MTRHPVRSRLAALPGLALLASALVAAPPAAGPGDDVQDLVVLAESRPVLVRLHLRNESRPFRTAWGDFLRHLFQAADADGNDKLSKEECEHLAAPILISGTSPFATAPPPALGEMDRDRDGVVSRDELADYYRRSGVGPFQLQGAPPVSRLPVTAAPVAVQAPLASGAAFNEALFGLLDADRDGGLSRQELARVPEVLGALDRNDDELVSAQEVSPGSVSGAVASIPPGRAPSSAGTSLVVPVAPGLASAHLATLLLARYGPDRRLKQLRRDHLGLGEGAFQRLDRDGNGSLDVEELARFADREPDVEATIRLENSPGADRVTLAHASGLPANMAQVTPGGALALEVGCTRIELRPQPPSPLPMVPVILNFFKAQFASADHDGNGHLDAGEARQASLFSALFKTLDTNRDGKVTEQELQAYVARLAHLAERARGACVTLGVQDRGRGLFDLLDTTHDGALGLREMRNAVRLLDSHDQDRDGRLGRAEVPRNYLLTLAQGPSTSPPVTARLAAAGGMPAAVPRPRPTAGPLWFRKMDRNGDGDVSRREFLGPDEEFMRIDTDGDGLLSTTEADQVEARLRGQKR